MKKVVEFVMLLAVSAALLNVAAAAQTSAPSRNASSPRAEFAVYNPAQNAATLQLADWDNRRRCDGDHDRDNRNCYYRRDRDDDRYRNQYYSQGYSYYGNASVYGQGGFYNQYGRWHSDPGGSYDRKGKWRRNNGHGHGDDR